MRLSAMWGFLFENLRYPGKFGHLGRCCLFSFYRQNALWTSNLPPNNQPHFDFQIVDFGCWCLVKWRIWWNCRIHFRPASSSHRNNTPVLCKIKIVPPRDTATAPRNAARTGSHQAISGKTPYMNLQLQVLYNYGMIMQAVVIHRSF